MLRRPGTLVLIALLVFLAITLLMNLPKLGP